MHRLKTKYVLEFLIHVLFWLGVYFVTRELTSASFRIQFYRNGSHTQRIDVRGAFPYTGILLGFLALLFYSNIFWLLKKAIRYKNNFGRMGVIAGWFLLVFLIDFLIIRQFLSYFGNVSPDLSLIPSGAPSPPGLLSTPESWLRMQLVVFLIFLSVLGIAIAYFFIGEWIRNDLLRSQIEAHQLSTELKFLRAQVNPHFLFNIVNNLFSLAQRKGNDELAEGLSKLSGMMRYMIYESNTDQVPLGEEIEYLEGCIALSRLRYAPGEVSVSFNRPEESEIAGSRIAPMLLLPFLENAFKHGVAIGQESRMVFSVCVEQNKLEFSCENTDYSGIRKLEGEQGGIGLDNVRRRLELLYPRRHQLRTQREDGKYMVNLQIDLS